MFWIFLGFVYCVPREHIYWQYKCIAWMHCKSLWIKASAKYINVNVNVWRRAEITFGHLLWLTGKCVQLNWSSILLDGYKKRSLLRQPSREDLLVRRSSTLPCDSTGQGHWIEVSLFIYLISYCLFHFCFSFYNQFLLCVSKLLFVSMCVWQCSFFRITDTLLPFDLSILILDTLHINLLCLYSYFLSF